MLKSINIKNYALIDDISIDFEKNFNVMTGETGAGKSIIVGALTFLLKGRNDTSLIQTGKDKATIEGIFSLDKNNVEIKNKLNEADIDADDEIIVRRVISKDRSTIKINDVTVTLNFLTDLFENFVDVHSQKDNHFLFDKKNHLILLDKYARLNDDLNEYNTLYKNYIELKRELDDLKNNTYNEREIEFLKYDLDELEDANLNINEEDELENIEKRIKSQEKYTNALTKAIDLYNNDKGIKEQLFDLINAIDIDDEDLSTIKNELTDIYYNLDDNMSKVSKIYESFNNAEFNIEDIEERLYIYSKLKRKHKTDTTGLIKLLDEIKAKIQFFNNKNEVLEEKEKELNKAYDKAMSKAKEISKKRKIASKNLATAIIKETNDLLLQNCQFEVKFNEIDLSYYGIDDLEFYISLNKGEDLKPLKNVASGGEVSRIMLALKVIFASLTETSLLIFDEIDTGISGKVALAVGLKIAKLSKTTQVITITHLAPVAACANDHYYIYKQDENNISRTHIKKLNNNEIISELAIMNSTNNNETALNAAKDLYDNCQQLIKEQ